MTHQGQIGIYFHWPFCLAKCPYCDFNVHIREGVDHDVWAGAFERSLDHYAALTPGREVASVFFGGGTPSLMAPATVERVLNRVQKNWRIKNDIEVTLEANPTSVENEKFKAFAAAGINRVSLGVQALNDPDLKFLGRKHSVSNALQAIDIARNSFERYSFDLIYARPNQQLKDWEQELEIAVQYADGHLSLYQLTIERSTPFFLDHSQGKFSVPNEDMAADFYTLTQDVLEGHGLPAYEVSNHAKPDHESRHNLIYWQYGDYIGIGPGAHGRLTIEGEKFAVREHQAPEIWLQKVEKEGSGAHPHEKITPQGRFMEALMMGLRLREGISLEVLAEQSGRTWRDMLDESKIARLQKEGWLVLEGDHLRLNREGLLRLNALIPYILR